jgi:hypothetical protein
MSDVAVTWAKAQDCPTSKAKQVLGCLATYADVEGEVWALVPVLAMESQSTDRTVQRALQALKGAGLIVLTGRSHVHRGKRVPIWRLNLDHGFASTRARMIAESRARSGDASVTPSASSGVTPVSPENVADVTARGDTGDTQIGNEDSQGLTPSASACAKAQRLWAEKAPERVSPDRVDAAWAAAIERTRVSEEQLLAAVAVAVRRDPDFTRNRAMNLDRWLAESRFLAWLTDADAEPSPGRVIWSGPPEIEAAVAAVMGPDQRASYLDPARWDGDRRAILTRTGFAADRLRSLAGKALRGLGVTIECETASASGGGHG